MTDKIFSMGFPAFVRHVEELERPKLGEEEKDTFVFNTKTISFAYSALSPIITPDIDINLLNQALLYAHHPLVLFQLGTKFTNSGQLWRNVLQAHKAERVFFDILMKTEHELHEPTEKLEEVTKYILGVVLNESSNMTLRKAASYAIATLAFTTLSHIIPTGNKDHEIQHEHNNCVIGQYILKQLSNALKDDADNLSKFAQSDFAVFEAPEGVLFHNIEEELARNPIFHANAIPPSASLYSLSGDEWQRVLKREKEIHSKQGKNATETLQDICKNLVTEQVLKRI